MNPSAVNLVIADPQEVFREGLKSVLGCLEWIRTYREASTDDGLFEIVESVDVDMVLVGLAAVRTTPAEFFQRLLEITTQVSVVVVVSEEELNCAKQALRFGAEGFLLRDAHSVEFVSALHNVAIGNHYIQPKLVQSLIGLTSPSRDRAAELLSVRQREILDHLIRGLRNKDIAAHLGISETTVKSELRLLYTALQASSRAEAAAIALRVGLVD